MKLGVPAGSCAAGVAACNCRCLATKPSAGLLRRKKHSRGSKTRDGTYTAQRHRLDSATLLAVASGCGPVIAGLLVLGSGILPVRFHVLLLFGLVVGIAASLPAIAFGQKRSHFRALAVLALLGTVIGSASVFIHYQEAGLNYAQRYAERWAAAIQAQRRVLGHWPRSIQEVAPGGKPLAPSLPWPYIARCHDDLCKVAGYFVSYRVEAQTPHLVVARRDIAVEWDWSSRTWREQSGR